MPLPEDPASKEAFFNERLYPKERLDDAKHEADTLAQSTGMRAYVIKDISGGYTVMESESAQDLSINNPNVVYKAEPPAVES